MARRWITLLLLGPDPGQLRRGWQRPGGEPVDDVDGSDHRGPCADHVDCGSCADDVDDGAAGRLPPALGGQRGGQALAFSRLAARPADEPIVFVVRFDG